MHRLSTALPLPHHPTNRWGCDEDPNFSELTSFSLFLLSPHLARFPGDGGYDHEQVLRGHLTGCGINAELQGVPSRGLSGGQRSRVAMAAVSFARPHVLILDEPTNNLDLEAVTALADCIEKFEGAVLIVSHDQYFVSRVAKEVWVVENNQVTRLPSFDDYIKKKKSAIV